jgi:hypothetical protein
MKEEDCVFSCGGKASCLCYILSPHINSWRHRGEVGSEEKGKERLFDLEADHTSGQAEVFIEIRMKNMCYWFLSCL